MEIVIKFDNKAEILIEKLIGAITNINSNAETWTTNRDGEAIPVAPIKEVPVVPTTKEEELPTIPTSNSTYTLAEVQLAASTFARSSETAAQQIKDVLKATFGVARISEIEENRLVEFANALISLGAKL